MNTSSSLLPADYSMLEASFITREIAHTAGLYRVDTVTGAELVGRRANANQDYGGIVFPYYWPDQTKPREYRLRRDKPTLKQQRDGTLREDGKYLNPPGRGNLLYVPVGTPSDWLTDLTVPITILEGEKKALATCRFFYERNENCLVLGLPGVWSWRGIVERTVAADGSPRYVKGPIPYLARIIWDGRNVTICFDVNVRTNPSVAKARRELAEELKSRGAVVLIIDIPEVDGVNGVDDLLAIKGPSFVADLFGTAKPFRGPETSSPYSSTPTGFLFQRQRNDAETTIRLTNFIAKIISDVVEDDGTETRRIFEIEATLNGQSIRDTISANEFAGMRWPTDLLGAQAVIYPNAQEHTRCAIQLLSTDVTSRQIYTHTGWRELDGKWCYLHSGGAIGAQGNLQVEVHLPASLEAFKLPIVPTADEWAESMSAVLTLLSVAPDSISVPVIGLSICAVLGNTDFAGHLAGPTGVGKSELTSLAQSFFGSGFTARNLPGNWSSTANALEAVAHTLKDALFAVDDFCPVGSSQDTSRLHREADRLLRAQGNHSGRQRMRSDATLRPVKAPRGTVLSTGEDVPRGESLRARLWVSDVEKNSLNWERLTKCQQAAREGVYAGTTKNNLARPSAYIRLG